MQVEPLSILRGSLDHAPPAFPLPEESESPGSGQDPAFLKGMEVSEDGGCRSSNPPESAAATKLQKVYRSYRTRRRLADSAVVAEELWWQAIEFVQLNRSTVSFFDHVKQESVVSRWNRIKLNASKVGQGLSKDAKFKALKLAFQHWIEAIDPRHRYGHNLHIYYEEWRKSEAGQPFFYWLDIGDGRDLDLKQCPRSFLRKQCVKYLGPQEREHYEYVPLDGKIVHRQTGVLLDTTSAAKGGKWIFVMSTSSKLYAGQKKKGIFHHSSFLAGGVTVAAGRFTAENGMLKRIWAYSGHYRPTKENFNNFLSFLKENHVNLDETEIMSSSNEDYYEDADNPQLEQVIESMKVSKTPQLALPLEATRMAASEPTAESESAVQLQVKYQRTLSGGLQSPRTDVSKKAILERINSKRKASSYQLGHQLSSKWCSGAGPRIGCVADYPFEVRLQALEFVNLSPKILTPPKGQSSKNLATP
ncbi:IQ domain-containing protein IQM3-like [Curcuma longa]|uniref:IQ domain-containing protein IQM3-like n=1 Tax=Curcuma longa TaxID=136217 RepID=UPI003D9E7AD5